MIEDVDTENPEDQFGYISGFPGSFNTSNVRAGGDIALTLTIPGSHLEAVMKLMRLPGVMFQIDVTRERVIEGDSYVQERNDLAQRRLRAESTWLPHEEATDRTTFGTSRTTRRRRDT